MRLSHKRNVLDKIQHILRVTTEKNVVENDKPKSAKALAKEAARSAAPKEKKAAAKKAPAKKAAAPKKSEAKKEAPKKEAPKKAEAKVEASNLTPKQQSILDILVKSKAALSAKDIGVEAGQEESKASAWATSGLKKLVEDGLVIKETEGNKATYKSA